MAVAPFHPADIVEVPAPRRHVYERDVVVRREAPRAVRREAPSAVRAVATNIMVLASTVAVTYCFSILLGNSMMERSRRETVQADVRARQASEDVTRLRDHLGRLLTMDAVETWAAGRGFESPYAQKQVESNQAVAEQPATEAGPTPD